MHIDDDLIGDDLIGDDEIIEVETTEITTIETTELALSKKSIWDEPDFSGLGLQSTCTFSPNDLKSAIDEYRDTPTPMTAIFSERGITWDSWYKIRDLSPEVSSYELRARIQKSKHYGTAVYNEVYELPKDSALYQTDRVSGKQVLTTAGQKWIEHRHKMLVKLAQIAETGSYVDSQRIDQTTRGVQVNVNLNSTPDPLELREMSMDQMIQALEPKQGKR